MHVYEETFPVNRMDLGTKFKVAFLLEQIAKRPYPPVFVVGAATEAGIPVLDGLTVVENLRGRWTRTASGFCGRR
jgi:hypothetical protein